MNRQERRQADRDAARPNPKATQADAKRFIDEAFTDRISWVAARVLLELVVTEGATPDVLAKIGRFLEAHPRASTAPKAGPDPDPAEPDPA